MAMKLKFNANLDYQNDAVSSVVGLFEGQNSMRGYFTFTGEVPIDTGANEYTGQGVANKFDISSNEDILNNLRKIQTNNQLAPSESLSASTMDFNIEMETGTGKTYVYLKTIFELNKKYGFTKFIIVVPSLAIKEGVYKSIQITKDHFQGLYENVTYDAFIYDSSKLEQVRNFAVNSNIQIMVINIQAFSRSFNPSALDDSKETNSTNIIHRPNDRLNGYKPITLIQETNPIVIIDEPQSSVSTNKSKEAVKSLNPLVTLRYSATHKEIQNLVYKLDAIDAYSMNLVKQIEVASFESRDYHNEAYLKLISVDGKKQTARVEIDQLKNGQVKRKIVTIKHGDDLSSIKLSNRDIYNGYIVKEIYFEKENEYLSFTNQNDILRIGKAIGDMDDLAIKRQQIRKTIEEHLNKELRLTRQGIKVLSLFFIDKVANYRSYDEEGNSLKGIYARIFEEEYKKLISKPKYSTLTKDVDIETAVEEIHNGYFSQDKSGKNKGKFKDTSGTTNVDDDTYSLIMRHKEKLLSFDSKLRFIFSHSALREGWDNPNVFQICTLNETKSALKKRQEIGRGLRLAVNQDGERIKDKNINILTVMANESYEDFAKTLQKEYEEEGIKFGVIEEDAFAHIPMKNRQGEIEPIGKKDSKQIFRFFIDLKYIKAGVKDSGKVLDKLKLAIEQGNVEVPERFKDIKPLIVEVVKKSSSDIPIKPATNRRTVRTNKRVYLDPNFKEFWDKIKYKTTYSVDFDTEELIAKCVEVLKDLDIKTPKLLYSKAGIAIDASGVKVNEKGVMLVHSQEHEIALPDIVTFLQNETFLTRKTIVNILIKSQTLDQFKRNPQEYMEEFLKIINQELNGMLIDGIRYTKLGDHYLQELFEDSELFGYLEKNLLERCESESSLYDHIIYDSETEKNFAEELENDEEVLVYTKLPGWFKINTPIGNYNPDWAILFEIDGEKKLYFVVETKGSTNQYKSLSQSEKDKIICAKKHFEALNNGVQFKGPVFNFRNFKTKISLD
ncbi:MAG: DEAD/DEAH box helicase family protein [Methanobrevibacter sp.]|jgi:type III restriction enzyme|nr:DEAD/DEAH box helicase family protein [Methanobrevibacter sp.]